MAGINAGGNAVGNTIPGAPIDQQDDYVFGIPQMEGGSAMRSYTDYQSTTNQQQVPVNGVPQNAANSADQSTTNQQQVSVNGVPQNAANSAALLNGYSVPMPLSSNNAVSPMPEPVATTPPTSTDFEISPYLEKVVLDPYKPLPLGVLNQHELMVDDVLSYLSSVIPPNLVDVLYSIPGVNNLLAAAGQSIDQFVSSLVGMLPPNLSLGSVLGSIANGAMAGLSSIGQLVGNIAAVANTALAIGMNIAAIPGQIINDALGYMANMGVQINVSAFISDSNNLSTRNTINGVANPSVSLPAMAGLSLGIINHSVSNPVPCVNAVRTINTPYKPTLLVPVMKSTSSSSFPAITKTTKAIGITPATTITKAVKAAGATQVKSVIATTASANAPATFKNAATASKAIGQTSAKKLAAVISAHPAATTAISSNIATYGNTKIKNLNAILSNSSVASTNTLVVNLADLPTNTVSTLITSIKTHTAPVTTSIVESLSALPGTSLTPIIVSISANGVLKTTNVVNNISVLPSADVLTMLSDIAATSSDAYIAANGVGPYAAILSDVTTYGLDTITAIATTLNDMGPTAQADYSTVSTLVSTYGVDTISTINAAIVNDTVPVTETLSDVTTLINTNTIDTVETINTNISDLGSSVVTSLILNIATLGLDNTNILTSIVDNQSVSILANSITQLTTDNPVALTTALAQIDIVDSDALSTIVDIVTATDAPGADVISTYVDNIANVDASVLINSLPIIANLSDIDTTRLASVISAAEPFTTLMQFNVSGIFLAYSAKKACELAALQGDYTAVLNVMNNYTYEFTIPFRRYLVNTILANYKASADTATMGDALSSQFLVNALNTICPGWDDGLRMGSPVKLHQGYFNATNDALNLLVLNQSTAIPAILQLDMKYAA